MPFFISVQTRIEAKRFESRSFDHMQSLVEWIDSHGKKGDAWHNGEHIFIETLEGRMKADVTDWIIKGTRGEFYPCKPDVFGVKYRPE